MRRITTGLIGTAVVVAAAAPAASGASSGTMVALRQTSLGRVLVVGSGHSRGRTLYMFSSDTRNRSRCAGSCASIWSPLLTSGTPRAGTGTQRSKLGTIRRGSARQVTYGGHPLYMYSGDSRAGQVNGEGMRTFGGAWWALNSNGRAVKNRASTPAPSPPNPYPYY
jgi:predicted lipoprotein with Yx(FWY)xxD motif